MMLSNVFSTLGMKISGGIIIALLLAVGVQTIRANSANAAKNEAIEQRVLAEVQHKVTAASLNALQARLGEMVADGELRAQRLNKALVEVDADIAPLREQAEKLEAGEIDITQVEGL